MMRNYSAAKAAAHAVAFGLQPELRRRFYESLCGALAASDPLAEGMPLELAEQVKAVFLRKGLAVWMDALCVSFREVRRGQYRPRPEPAGVQCYFCHGRVRYSLPGRWGRVTLHCCVPCCMNSETRHPAGAQAGRTAREDEDPFIRPIAKGRLA